MSLTTLLRATALAPSGLRRFCSTKLPDYVVRGHNVVIGPNVVFRRPADASVLTRLHNNAVIGAFADIGPGVTVQNNVVIGFNAKIGANVCVERDVPALGTASRPLGYFDTQRVGRLLWHFSRKCLPCATPHDDCFCLRVLVSVFC